MLGLITKRIFLFLPISLIVIILVASILRLIPGDPVDKIAGPYATESEKLAIKKQIGLSDPLPIQISNYLKNIFHGNLGKSIITGEDITQMIARRIVPTFEIAILAVLFSVFLGLGFGIIGAIYNGKWPDFLSLFLSLLGVSMPNFWLGPLLVLLFAVQLQILPVSERTGLASYILPMITLGFSLSAITARITRSSLLDQLNEQYVLVARSKGLSFKDILIHHVFKNAAIPITTIIGLQLGALLTGAIITEKIFDWPGIGLLLVESIQNRDYPVVQACVLIFSISYLMINLLTDVCYMLLNPRVLKSGS
jgi:peptide/nickel transport system permease protein